MMPGLTAEGRRHRRCRLAMQMALRLNITPAEAQRRMRQERRASRKARQESRFNDAIGNCGTEVAFEQFEAPWMLRD
ncbi:hypothetical protein [Sphingorhabdus sp. 109]|uniref:hypothetical protein n=1 Tax=Sphingorhabdus sp. 109 TaxID=2653173 RepID=UPI0012F2AC0B|nr:hypothetical protein [Sphingorhabdus sp. 109]VWX62530.1 hypothetical protein SPHINGOR109_90007 [Sphingorhabdus sp. 109]